MMKFLPIMISAIAILLVLAHIDDDLSEQAIGLLDRIESAANSSSYLYLSGIFANENEDSITIGRRILEESRKLEADSSYKVSEYDESKKLPFPKGEAFCRAWKSDCLVSLFSTDVDIEKLITEHKVLVSRSNQFLAFKAYKTLTKPTINKQPPPYRYVVAAERIKVLKAISIYKNGRPEEAIESLSLQLKTLRKSMELQDNL